MSASLGTHVDCAVENIADGICEGKSDDTDHVKRSSRLDYPVRRWFSGG